MAGECIRCNCKDPCCCFKKKKCLYTIWVLLVAAIFISQSIIIYIDLHNISDLYQNLIENWKQNPISNIYPVLISQDCPKNTVDFIYYRFPGTQIGCHCYNDTILLKSCCEINQLSCDTCEGSNVDSMEPLIFNIWGIRKSSTNRTIPFRLCAERIPEYNFLQKAPQQQQQCKDQEKLCGQGTNQQETMYCIPKQYNCPITDLYISSSNSPKKSNAYEEIPLYNNLSLYAARESGQYPVSESYVSEGAGVCYPNKQVLNVNISRKYYPLLYPKKKDCLVDPRFLEMNAQIDESTFYLLNDRFYKIKLNLPNYDLNPNFIYKLYYRSYIPLKMQCRYLISDFKQNSITTTDFESLVLIILIIFNIFAFYLIFIESWIGFIYERGKVHGITVFEQNVSLKWAINIPKLLIEIIAGFIVIWEFILFHRQKSLVNKVNSQDCVDDLTLNMLSTIQNQMNSVSIDLLFAFLLVYIVLEPNFVYMAINFYEYCKNYDKSLNDQNNTQQNNQYMLEQINQQNKSIGNIELNSNIQDIQQSQIINQDQLNNNNINYKSQFPIPAHQQNAAMYYSQYNANLNMDNNATYKQLPLQQQSTFQSRQFPLHPELQKK